MPLITLTQKQRFYYRVAQTALYSITFLLLIFLILRSLFPTTIDTFNFENPTSSKHTLIPPLNENRDVVYNGRIDENASLIFSLGASAEDSKARLNVLVEEKSPLPSQLQFVLKHGYRATWLPGGDTIYDFPAEDFYVNDGIYYAFRENKLIRFVSRDAFISRYPEEFAKPLSEAEFKEFSVGNGVIGFRPGLLTAYGDGVFIIMNETEMRPVGSARIFLDLGYRFEDVQNINAEELGIYKRGKIFLSGDRHPDGSLFQDTVTARYYLVSEGKFREIAPGRYLDFLLSKTRPVLFSSETKERSVSCDAEANIFTHGMHCSVDLTPISSSIGSDYEIRLNSKGSASDLRFFEVRFQTAQNKANFNFIIAQMKDLLFTRFGLN
jgi:hypothetical protein